VTDEQLQTLRAAVRVKLGLSADVTALIRGLPQRHAVEMSLAETANFVLGRFACDNETETQILNRRPWAIGNE